MLLASNLLTYTFAYFYKSIKWQNKDKAVISTKTKLNPLEGLDKDWKNLEWFWIRMFHYTKKKQY